MKLEKIDVATNGFVLHDDYGNIHIASSLSAAAVIAGEGVQAPSVSNYAQGCSTETLRQVIALMRSNRKIDAIKLLRDCYTPRLGLKEAKELAEILA